MKIECPNCEARLQIPALPEDDTAIKCPKCKEAFYPSAPDSDDEDDDDRPARGKKAKYAPKKGAPPSTAKIAGTIVAAIFALGAVVWVLVVAVGPRDDKPAKKNNTEAVEKGGSTVVAQGIEGRSTKAVPIPVEITTLFKDAVDRPAPTVLVPALEPVKEDDLTRLALTAAPPGKIDPEAGKMDIDAVKKACCFIKVELGPLGGGTGSGFLIRADGKTGLIATNQHVAQPAVGGDGGGKITVVFDSGLPTQYSYPAEIVAADAEIDLAILKVTNADKLPKPIETRFAQPPVETQDLVIYGFPFGDNLSFGSKTPAITVSKGAVSSVRRNDAGKVVKVQFDAVVNPGNSGGAVLDTKGRIVGVTVSKIRDVAGIGFAVPGEELVAMVEGRVSPPEFDSADVIGSEAVFQVHVPVADPLKRVKSAALHVWSGSGSPPAAPKDAPHKPLAGSKSVPLGAVSDGRASGQFRIPAEPSGRPVVVQTAITLATGETVVSAPVAFKMSSSKAQKASDAIPMSAFARNLAKYEGQVVVVRGKVMNAGSAKWNVFEMMVNDEANKAIPDVVFLTATDVSVQLGEIPVQLWEIAPPCRITLRVGQKGADGKTPVRVTRVDLVGKGDRVVRSIPTTEEDADPLLALNRDPDKFVGREVTFEGGMRPVAIGTAAQPELVFFMFAGPPAGNLYFTTDPALVERMKALKLDETRIHTVRVTAKVESRKHNGLTAVTVTKIEFTDRGRVLHTVE